MMPPTPKAVRVRTSNGWQDIALIGPQGPPSGAMQLIEDKILSAAAPSFDFQNIPQTFAHLQLIVYGRSDQAVSTTQVYLRANNDSAANYDFVLAALSPTYAAVEAVAQTALQIGYMPGGSAVANSFGSNIVDIPNYAQAVGLKNFSMFASMKPQLSAGNYNTHILSGFWRNTVAINRLTVLPGAGNFVAGSRATLYGLSVETEGMRQNWTDIYCQVPQGANPRTSCANGLWTQILIPAVGASFIITRSDGINDDFTRNADGSVSINKAGNYHIEAVASEIDAAWPDAASINFGLAKANGRAPTTNDWLVVGQYTSGSATNNYPSCPVSCDVYCAVGDRINGWFWHNSGSARNIALRNFSITKAGSGPPGPLGGQIPSAYAVTAGYTADRTFNPEASSLTEIARTLGTLIDDMKSSGLIKV
jgi:hypothetical protein